MKSIFIFENCKASTKMKIIKNLKTEKILSSLEKQEQTLRINAIVFFCSVLDLQIVWLLHKYRGVH